MNKLPINRFLLVLVLILGVSSCRSKKAVITKKSKASKTKNEVKIANRSDITNYSLVADDVIENAKQFNGVRYKYGGTTKKGMDCSGLVYTAFKKEDIHVPRTTKNLKNYGNWVDINEVQKGDLLFFATKKNSKKVNHVGIVTDSRIGNVEFIHASTSNGVMISNLAERYWYFAFVQARRVL